MADRSRMLIEEWLPIETIGAETMRERGASSALPPLNFLHVWWARRPLTASRASILASVLPAWSESWPRELKERFPTRDAYHAWLLELCGIFGDPVAGRKRIQWAKERNLKLKTPPYTHARAFTVNPSDDHLRLLRRLLKEAWGREDLSVLDPFAGGGSIPFEAMRYGFTTLANELNPVASVILKATLDYPFRFGAGLQKDIRKYGKVITERVRERLESYFPVAAGESVHAYIWARTVACPYTGKPIPLSPNWWLQKGGTPIAARPVFDPGADEARFEILEGKAALKGFDPDEGTVARGNAVSPWAQNQAVDGDYIKAEAQAGRMGQQLFALGLKTTRGFQFRPPSAADVEAVRRAEEELQRRWSGWIAADLIPSDPIPDGNKTSEPRRYGMYAWSELFSPRQLLSLCTYLEVFKEVAEQVRAELGPERAEAVITYLAFVLDKAADRNSVMARWIPQRQAMANTFDRHDFSFKWSHGEFDGARNLFTWGLDQVVDSYKGLAKLAERPRSMFDGGMSHAAATVLQGSALHLDRIPTGSVHHVNVDPPYYDNVMYAECSDFFYVWMKRSLGDVHPEFFRAQLTNKDDEAVANVARFQGMGRKTRPLAMSDYERKMAASFAEMHRVLRDDGVLTVMFTHKKVEAWDTLATALIGAGFAIHSSWPLHTEFQHSLHISKKNAAESTILLTSRKRPLDQEPVWWDDIKGRVRATARAKAREFEAMGIRGVDLYIATFGPTLSILSESWPVLTSEVDERTGEPLPLQPGVALDLAREEVIGLRKQGLLLGRSLDFDHYTDWYLMAWDAFQAQEFPADEARKLAIALGLDLERQVIAEQRLVTKKASRVVIRTPKERRAKGRVDPEQDRFASWLDAVHTAMVLYEEDGPRACREFLQRTGYLVDTTFKGVVQAMLNAIPRTKQKGEFVRPEAATLDALRLSFFHDLEVPADEAEELVEQTELLDG